MFRTIYTKQILYSCDNSWHEPHSGCGHVLVTVVLTHWSCLVPTQFNLHHTHTPFIHTKFLKDSAGNLETHWLLLMRYYKM